MRLASALSGLSLGVLLCASAHAQGRDPAAAEALFRDGRKLMDEGKVAEACEKFQASQELDPGVGTLLNLAACYEKAGRTASAWATYREAQGEAQKAGDKARSKLASTRASALESRLSMLTIEVPEASRVDGLTIRRGDVGVGRSVWGTPTPVDPGTTTITASAPGKATWTKSVEIGDNGKTTVTIPVLETEAAGPTEEPSSVTPAVTPIDSGPSEAKSGSNTQRTLGFVAIGVGVVGLGVGGFFGIRARSKWNDAKGHCSNETSECDEKGLELGDQAGKSADISTVAFAVGGVALAGGVVLWLTAPKARAEAKARFGVGPGPTWWGVSAHGTY